MIDKKLIDTKHLTVYLSTLQIGVGLMLVPQNKEFHIVIGVVEICIR